MRRTKVYDSSEEQWEAYKKSKIHRKAGLGRMSDNPVINFKKQQERQLSVKEWNERYGKKPSEEKVLEQFRLFMVPNAESQYKEVLYKPGKHYDLYKCGDWVRKKHQSAFDIINVKYKIYRKGNEKATEVFDDITKALLAFDEYEKYGHLKDRTLFHGQTFGI